jgi:glycosyltransferase involved in cell wall biosynthesis
VRTLRLAVDAHDLPRDRRGIGTYARAVLARFARRDDVALTLLVRDWFPGRRAAVLRTALGEAAAPAMFRCAQRVPRRTDVVWHPWNGTFFGGAAPAVATIHDLIAFALPAADERRRTSQQAPIRRTGATARAIVCDSAYTAGDVQRYLGVDANRLHVVPLGVEPAFSPGGLEALPAELRERRYVLYVGAHDAHKNVLTLVAAYRSAFAGGDVGLVFTRPNPLVAEAIVIENAPLATLVALYRAALVVAVPSIYEGFGLPVLEGLACGAPVLAARATALPEAGGDAAAYVDEPCDPDAWRAALLAISSDGKRRAALSHAGPLRAAAFTWDACADHTLAILRASATLPLAAKT